MRYRTSIFFIIAGIFFIGMSQTNSDLLSSIIALIAGLIAFTYGILDIIGDFQKNQKKKKESKPTCEYCRYVALDERELHNHQITCEKKN